MKTLTIVIDPGCAECLYIDGVAWEGREFVIYATDIAEALAEEEGVIECKEIDWQHDEWPESLEDALRQPLKIADESEGATS